MLRMLLAPARGGRSMFTLVTASFGIFSRAVQKVLGAQLLTDLSGFVAALDSMFGGFRQRADETDRILQDPQTAFLLVAAPERDAVREDRKSTRLNSSHANISYAGFCLKKKTAS